MIATGGAVVVTRAILAARQGIDSRTPLADHHAREISQLKRELAALPCVTHGTSHLPAAQADIFQPHSSRLSKC